MRELLAELGHDLTVLAPGAEDRIEERATGGRIVWIKAPVLPFDLPMTDATVAATFIGVMTTPDRAASQAAWAALLVRLRAFFSDFFLRPTCTISSESGP